jgi:trehalose synthase
MFEVPIARAPVAELLAAAPPAQRNALRAVVRRGRRRLKGRRVWHINSTATGGGVAEMLQSLLGYERDGGIDARWLVLEGDAPFFALTKRLHHLLHGRNGHAHGLSASHAAVYRATMQRNLRSLGRRVRRGDFVVLHDPQTAGLAPTLAARGAHVVWRCHIGTDDINAAAREGWAFLQPFLLDAHGWIFSRREYVPSWVPTDRTYVVPPAIDPRSVKNAPLTRVGAHAILRQIGLLAVDDTRVSREAEFTRADGSPARVLRRAAIEQLAQLPGVGTPIIVQVSRWDPLKDMAGVMLGFAARAPRLPGIHLVLAGPDVRGVSDDPEGASVYADCVARWKRLPRAARSRVHLVSLPMDDAEENAAMVNAIQRHATILVQKSLREGFGLTVTEAMWKGRPVVASAVGGIRDQIVDGVHGLLLESPTDRRAFGRTLERLAQDRHLLQRLGRNARRRVRSRFLGHRRLVQFLGVFDALGGSPR